MSRKTLYLHYSHKLFHAVTQSANSESAVRLGTSTGCCNHIMWSISGDVCITNVCCGGVGSV